MNPVSNIPPIFDSSGSIGSSSLAAPGVSGTTTANGNVTGGGTFADALTSAVRAVSGLQNNADSAVAGLATNSGVDIHQAMLAMDQASLGMSLAVQVRNK